MKLFMSSIPSTVAAIIEDAIFVSTNFDMSSATRTSVDNLPGTPTDIEFKTDGTKLFVSVSGSTTIYEYALSTPWDISTVSSTASATVSVSTLTEVTTIDFNRNGTALYACGSGKLAVIPLTSSYDLRFAGTQETLDISSYTGQTIDGACFSNTSSNNYLHVTSSDTNYVNTITTLELASPLSGTSLVGRSSNLVPFVQDVVASDLYATKTLEVSGQGERFYQIFRNTDLSNVFAVEFKLGTPHDASTLTSKTQIEDFTDLAAQTGGTFTYDPTRSIKLKPDGTEMFLSGTDFFGTALSSSTSGSQTIGHSRDLTYVTTGLHGSSSRLFIYKYDDSSQTFALDQTVFNIDGNILFQTEQRISNDGTLLIAPYAGGYYYTINQYDGSTWSTLHKFRTVSPTNSRPGEGGIDLSTSENVAVLGATNTHKFFVSSNNSGTWSFDTYNMPGSTGPHSISITDESVLAIGDYSNAFHGAGVIHLYEKVSGTWTLSETLVSPDSGTGLRFAERGTMEMNGDSTVIAVGAYAYSSNKGRVYIYEKSGGSWSLYQTIDNPNGTAADVFGHSVSINSAGDKIIAGARAYSSNKGRVYVFDRLDGTWTLTNTIDTPTTGKQFGFSSQLSWDGSRIAAYETSTIRYYSSPKNTQTYSLDIPQPAIYISGDQSATYEILDGNTNVTVTGNAVFTQTTDRVKKGTHGIRVGTIDQIIVIPPEITTQVNESSDYHVVSLWAWIDTNATGSHIIFESSGYHGQVPSSSGYTIMLNGNNRFYVYIKNTSGQLKDNYTNVIFSSSLLDQWIHLVFVLPIALSTTVVPHMYMNAVRYEFTVATNYSQLNYPAGQGFAIGGRYSRTSSELFDAYLDEIKVFNTLLSEKTVKKIYLDGLPPHKAQAFHLAFEDSTGAEILPSGASLGGTSLATLQSNTVPYQGNYVGDYTSSSAVTTLSNWSAFDHPFTVSFWMYYTGDTAATNKTIVGLAGWSSNGFRVRLNASTLYFYYNASAVSSAITNFVNNWTHVTVTSDGTIHRLFYNGSSPGSATSSVSYTSGQTLYIGAETDSSPSEVFTGYLDDIRIYDYVLDPQEVGYVYTSSIHHTEQNFYLSYDQSNVYELHEGAEDKAATGTGQYTQDPGSKIGTHSGSYNNDGVGTVVPKWIQLSDSTELSLSFWVFMGSLASGTHSFVETANYGTSGYNGIQVLFRNDSGTFHIEPSRSVGTTLNHRRWRVSTTLGDYLNKWVHVVVVYSTGDYGRVFVNGTKLETNAATTGSSGYTGISSNETLVIGKNAVGSIDDFRVFGRAFPDEEAQALYDKYAYTRIYTDLQVVSNTYVPPLVYSWDSDIPFRVDGILTYDQVGLDLATLSQTDIDCVTIDRTRTIVALCTGQRVQMYKTSAPSSTSLQDFRLENFYSGTYAHPDVSYTGSAFVNNAALSGSNVTMIAFSPNNYLWYVVVYNTTRLTIGVAGNVNSSSEFTSFSPVASADFGHGISVSIQFYGGYVYIARQLTSPRTWIIERWDFTEPTPAEYEALTNNFNPETLGYFSNKQTSTNLYSTTFSGQNEQLHGMYVTNNGNTLMTCVRGGGYIYFHNLTTAYDITSSSISSSTPYLAPSSSQYYWDPAATRLPMSYAISYNASDVGQVTVLEEENGETPMFLMDMRSTGTTVDNQHFLALVRAERSGDPDPLTTIHLDFEDPNTYRVNTLFPTSITYTQNSQYAIVGSNCAYLNGGSSIEIVHDTEDGTNNFEKLYYYKHSFSGWFLFSSLSGTVPLIGTTVSTQPRLLYNSSGNYISAHAQSTAQDREMRWNYTFSTDTWYHVCYALQISNSEGMILWINGTQVSRTYVSTGITSFAESARIHRETIMAFPDGAATNTHIGRYTNTYMTGYVDDIRYYMGRIPTSYVATLYALKNPTKLLSFTYTSSSITITKSDESAKDWSWTLNGTSQGTVTGASGLTQTITGLTLVGADVIVVTMNGSSITKTVSVEYSPRTDYPLRLDSVLFGDQAGIPEGTFTIDSMAISPDLRVIAISNGQKAHFIYSNALTSRNDFRLENFYSGSYADPRLSSNAYISPQISIAGANVTRIRFTPNYYVWALIQYSTTHQAFSVSGNVLPGNEFTALSTIKSTTDYGAGIPTGLTFYDGKVFICRTGGTSVIMEVSDFNEPTPAEYEALPGGFNPKTEGIFTNTTTYNLTSLGLNYSNSPVEIHFTEGGSILILSIESNFGDFYYFDCPTPYDIGSIPTFDRSNAFTYSSAQYYDLGATSRLHFASNGDNALAASHLIPITNDNGDVNMLVGTGKFQGSTDDEEYMMTLYRWESDLDPDPLPTIHIDFESSDTYLVNTHNPAATISYVQDSTNAVVGSNCASLSGTSGTAIKIVEPNVGRPDQRDFLTRPHSLSCWFKFNTLSGIQSLVSSEGNAGRVRFDYDATNGYFLMKVVKSGSDTYEMRWDYTLSTGTWYHVVYMCNVNATPDASNPPPSGMLLWVNGSAVTRTYASSTYLSLTTDRRVAQRSQIMAALGYSIGFLNDPPDYWIGNGIDGYVDDVRLYKARLPDSYVATLYALKNPTTISLFTATTASITITKTDGDATDWSWSLNGADQGTVSGASGTTQTITGLTLADGDVVVVTMNETSVTETLDFSSTEYTIAFHYGSFDNVYSDGSVATAASNGHIYDNTPTGTYSWGTIGSVSTASGQTTYTWTPPSSVTADVLLVAGGGGGGGTDAGGGGAGGVVFSSSTSISGQKTIRVGNGGLGGLGWQNTPGYGQQGSDTEFTGITTAVGGGGGGNNGANGGESSVSGNRNGGSGGGSDGVNTNGGGGGTATSGQGYNGGAGYYSSPWSGGGGGGAGGAGGNGTSSSGGNGGLGYDYSSTFSSTYGDSGWFASGGGGGSRTANGGSPGTASQGGGTDGTGSTTAATDASSHTGGGGGGSSYSGQTTSRLGGDGGSGIVLIRFSV